MGKRASGFTLPPDPLYVVVFGCGLRKMAFWREEFTRLARVR